MALVPRGRRQGRGGHRRHLVADGDRRLPVQHHAGPAPDEAGQRGPGHARHSSGHLRRERQGGVGRLRQSRATSASATRGRGSSRPSGATASASSATYYAKYCKNPKSKDWRDWPYFAGDGAMQAPDGYYRILGRVDDVINVAGHRLGTKELESASSHRGGDRRGGGGAGGR